MCPYSEFVRRCRVQRGFVVCQEKHGGDSDSTAEIFNVNVHLIWFSCLYIRYWRCFNVYANKRCTMQIFFLVLVILKCSFCFHLLSVCATFLEHLSFFFQQLHFLNCCNDGYYKMIKIKVFIRACMVISEIHCFHFRNEKRFVLF